MTLFPRLNLIPGRLGYTRESPRTWAAGLANEIFVTSSNNSISLEERLSLMGLKREGIF